MILSKETLPVYIQLTPFVKIVRVYHARKIYAREIFGKTGKNSPWRKKENDHEPHEKHKPLPG
jgi:hypothetical protein